MRRGSSFPTLDDGALSPHQNLASFALIGKDFAMNDRTLRVLACIGLAIGGALGMAGSFVPSASLRGLLWGVDGTALVMATALLTVVFFRWGQDLVAAGFLVFAVGQGIMLSGAAMDVAASGPSFGAGSILWAMALALVSVPRVFPLWSRVTGFLAAILFVATALQIFAGTGLTPLSRPLPSFAYPVFVATFVGWIFTLWKSDTSRSG